MWRLEIYTHFCESSVRSLHAAVGLCWLHWKLYILFIKADFIYYRTISLYCDFYLKKNQFNMNIFRVLSYQTSLKGGQNVIILVKWSLKESDQITNTMSKGRRCDRRLGNTFDEGQSEDPNVVIYGEKNLRQLKTKIWQIK